MANETGASPAKNRKRTLEETHFLEDHVTIVFHKDTNRIDIGFAYGCPKPPCPGAKDQPTVAFYSCPKPPCPPPGT